MPGSNKLHRCNLIFAREDDTISLVQGDVSGIPGMLNFASVLVASGRFDLFYAFQLFPQFWHTHIEMCFCLSFCFLGRKAANIAGIVKKSHFIKIHHQPMNSHQIIPWCLFLSWVSVTACTFTFSLPHFGHFIIVVPFRIVFYINSNTPMVGSK